MFDFELEKNKKVFLVIFFGNYEENELYFTSQVEDTYRKHHRPDHVLFISDFISAEKVDKKKEEDSAFRSNIERYGKNTEITVIGLGENGEVKYINGGTKKAAKEYMPLVLQKGLETLCKLNSVIEHSPPGTAFLKPSNKIEKFFISGHRIAQNSSQTLFIAFCIIRKLNDIEKITDIFYDTSSINYIAMAIIWLVNRCQNSFSFNPRHKSFHSYTGIKDIIIDDPKRSLFLISASTSDNLLELIRDFHHVDRENIVSIISTTQSERNLVKIAKPGIDKSINYTPKLIRKVDEYFTSEVNPPNLVTIKSIHGKELKNWPFKLIHNQNISRCNASNSDRTKVREFAIRLPDDDFSGPCSKDIEKWWINIIDWHVRANTRWIITDPNDPICMKFLSHINERVNLRLEVIDIKGLSDYDFENSTKSLIVYLPSIASGDIFISANRDMRLGKHDGMRLFLCNFHLFRGIENLKKFESSLSFGPDLNKYKFFCQYKINIPYREIRSSWERENNLLAEIDSSNELFSKRKAVLSQTGEGLNGLIGIHATDCEKPLQFTRHFAFWRDFEYDENTVSPESVYFSVASILQEARDSKDFTGQDSLAFSISQQSLLAPDNFVRFNDPLLQSCIWRAAKDSETDYSNDNEISLLFAEILLRLLKHKDNEKGSASLDLLFGIAMEKIKLSNEAINKIMASPHAFGTKRFDAVCKYIKNLYKV